MVVEDKTVSFSLEINIEKADVEMRKLLTVCYRALGLLRRMGLSEDLTNAITHVQRLITVINQLRLAMLALQAASGPIGWAMAGIGVVSAALITSDYAMEVASY